MHNNRVERKKIILFNIKIQLNFIFVKKLNLTRLVALNIKLSIIPRLLHEKMKRLKFRSSQIRNNMAISFFYCRLSMCSQPHLVRF